jgi:hypothetical protein
VLARAFGNDTVGRAVHGLGQIEHARIL